jgi:hypothetical protein
MCAGSCVWTEAEESNAMPSPDSMTTYFSFVFIGKLYAELFQSVARPVHYLNQRKDRRFRPRGRATRALSQ